MRHAHRLLAALAAFGGVMGGALMIVSRMQFVTWLHLGENAFFWIVGVTLAVVLFAWWMMFGSADEDDEELDSREDADEDNTHVEGRGYPGSLVETGAQRILCGGAVLLNHRRDFGESQRMGNRIILHALIGKSLAG